MFFISILFDIISNFVKENNLVTLHGPTKHYVLTYESF